MSGLASRGELRASFLRWAIVCVPAVVVLGFLSGLSVQNGDQSAWYRALAKPALTPPGWLFPVAWTFLYICQGLAIATILNARGARGRGLAIGLFVAQLAVNLAWTPIFFGAHRIALGLVTIAMMLALAVATTFAFARIRRRAAWLMLPYLVWISFAGVLNWRIGQLNPQADGLASAPRTTQMID